MSDSTAYSVHWRLKVKPGDKFSSIGTTLSKAMAISFVETCDKRWPARYHWIEPV